MVSVVGRCYGSLMEGLGTSDGNRAVFDRALEHRAMCCRIALVALCCSVGTVALHAQQAVGTLVGTVRTATGEMVPDAVIIATGESREFTVRTDADGEFRFEGLVPGPYVVTIDRPPFVVEPAAPITAVAYITIRRDMTMLSPEDLEGEDWRASPLLEASPGQAGSTVAGSVVERGQVPLLRLLEYAPGVTVTRAGGVGQPTTVRVRGVETGDRFLLTDGRLLNDLPSRFHLNAPGQPAVLEVIRGAPLSARGEGLTGAAHFLTDAGTPRVAFDVEAGQLEWRQVSAMASGGLGDYDWAVGARNLEMDNEQPNSAYVQTVVGGTVGLVRDNMSAQLMFRGETSTVGLPGPTLFVRPDLDAREEGDRWLVGATLRLGQSAARPSHEFRLVASQTTRHSLNPLDSGAARLQSSAEPGLRFEILDTPLGVGLRNDTQEARLTYEYTHPIDEFHVITGGGTVEVEGGRFGTSARFDQQRLSLAGYGQDRIQVFENLSVTAGGRFVKNGPYDFFAQPRGSLTYGLGRGWVVHASAGYGIGTPTLEQRFGATLDRQGNVDLVQAKSKTADGGIGRAWGARAQVDFTGFRHVYSDLVVLGSVDIPALRTIDAFQQLTLFERGQYLRDVSDGLRDPFTATLLDLRTGYINLPRSWAHGLEATASIRPISQVELRGVYTFTESEVTTGTDRIKAGQSLPQVPKHQATFTGDVQVGPFSAGAAMRYVGEREPGIDVFTQALGLDVVESYIRWDAAGRFAVTDRVMLSVVGENLTGEVYQDVLGYPALGRLFRAGVHVSF